MGFYRGPQIVKSGLVLHLDAANPKSYPGTGTTWSDRAGNLNGGVVNNGTLVNGPSFSSANMGSIGFDGSNDYVDMSTSPNLTNSLTVCVFVNISLITGLNQVIYGPSANGSDNWISISNNRAQIYATQVSDVNNFSITGNTVIEANKWYHITGIVNNNIISLYVNGVFDVAPSTQTFTVGGWNSTARIGQRATGQFPFNGRIACLQGYNRALSATEVLQNYNALKSRFI